MPTINSYQVAGAEDISSIDGYKVVKVDDYSAKEEGYIVTTIVITFENEHNVRKELSISDTGDIHISEPYAKTKD